MRTLLTFMLIAALATPAAALAQVRDDVWRGVAAKIDVGTEVHVRLRGGQRFRATLVDARDEAVLLQPKTRVPVPVQAVPYTEILSLERRTHGGMGAAKAAVIGVASGVGAFFAIVAIFVAAMD